MDTDLSSPRHAPVCSPAPVIIAARPVLHQLGLDQGSEQLGLNRLPRVLLRREPEVVPAEVGDLKEYVTPLKTVEVKFSFFLFSLSRGK